MNLYDYLLERRGKTAGGCAKAAREAYDRFVKYGKTCVPQQTCDPFTFVFSEYGFQAFTFCPDQIVTTNGHLGIVTGWCDTPSGYAVCIKTASGDYRCLADNVEQADYPEGLVEILRGKVHQKVDEAFDGGEHA